MQHRRRHSLLGLGLASTVLAVACSGSMASPLGPTTGTPATTGGSTTIKGRTAAMRSTSAVRPSASPSTIRVCVSGTSTCTDVDAAGNFIITGNFSGDVQLEFVGPQGTVNFVVPDVQPGETVVVTVEISGGTTAIHIESRTGTDDAADEDSEDDVSEDDESEDSPDDESEDDESEDDESEDDEEDDDSEDDDSEDEDEDDDSEDDDKVKDNGRSGRTL